MFRNYNRVSFFNTRPIVIPKYVANYFSSSYYLLHFVLVALQITIPNTLGKKFRNNGLNLLLQNFTISIPKITSNFSFPFGKIQYLFFFLQLLHILSN